jgi:signal transduction histidine kinase
MARSALRNGEHSLLALPLCSRVAQRPFLYTVQIDHHLLQLKRTYRALPGYGYKELLELEQQDQKATMAQHYTPETTRLTPPPMDSGRISPHPPGQQLVQAGEDSEAIARHRLWPVAAQISLFIISALALLITIVGTPVYFAWVHAICTNCNDERLTPARLQALHALGISLNTYALYWVAVNILFALLYFVVAALIYWRKPADRMALFASIALVALGASFPTIPDILATIYPGWWLPVKFLHALGFPCLIAFLFLFPTGHFVPRWTRWVAVGYAALFVIGTFFPGSILNFTSWPRLLSLPLPLGVYGSIVLAQVHRYRRVSTPVERQQTKWVVFGVAVALIGFLLLAFLPLALLPLFFPLQNLTLLSSISLVTSVYLLFLLIPLSIAIAILRYRLWDIDIIIRRTLVYGVLTACIIGLYALVVGGLGTLFQGQGNGVISLLATGLVAVLFSPLRDRLQRAVNRLMYGERDDPYLVISRLGQRLEATLAPDAVLPTIVETVAQALKLPYAAMTLKQGSEFPIVASYGEVPPGVLVHLPLIYRTEYIGELVLAPRGPSEPFSSADRELLSDLARQAGSAAHAVGLTADLKHLTADLQHSRERLVTTREEERRRLRRDLHDGLGPTLATITLKAEAARDAIPTDPAEAMDLLEGLVGQAQTAISDIRRLVYDLRPPALDDLGLVAAVRAQMTQYEHAGLRITFDAPDRLPELSAAVEVAVYRIIQEALTNIVRHASANFCLIRLTPGETLQLEIKDDGRGIPTTRLAGVGLRSMHERAVELGGSCSVEAIPGGGTRVYALLPCVLPGAEPDVPAAQSSM